MGKVEMGHRFQLRFTSALHEAVQGYAEAHGMNFSDAVRALITRGLAEREAEASNAQSAIRNAEISEFLFIAVSQLVLKSVPELRDTIMAETERNIRTFHQRPGRK